MEIYPIELIQQIEKRAIRQTVRGKEIPEFGPAIQ